MTITAKTKITGIMGFPVIHSLSPVFQNAAFESMKIDFVYIPLEVKPSDLDKAIEGVRAMNFAGVNVTIPHKKKVAGYLDEIDDEARILGAVNTIVNTDGILKGYITDGTGFVRSLKEHQQGFDFHGKSVFILGAGGSAYAISGALVKEKVSGIYISNRTEEKAVLLKKHLSEKAGFQNSEVVSFEGINEGNHLKYADIVVNTTSVGMKDGDPVLINEKNLEGKKFVYDIIYNRKTELIRTAEKIGIPCLGGMSMLVYQGAVAFELWTGKEAPVSVMKNVLKII